VELLGARSGTEGLQAFTELSLELLQVHGIGTLAATRDSPDSARRFLSAGRGYVVAVTDQHDCQPPTPEAIGQIWICPVCGDSWVCKEGAVIGGELISWVRQPAETE
jgi:hypothetical protein